MKMNDGIKASNETLTDIALQYTIHVKASNETLTDIALQYTIYYTKLTYTIKYTNYAVYIR